MKINIIKYRYFYVFEVVLQPFVCILYRCNKSPKILNLDAVTKEYMSVSQSQNHYSDNILGDVTGWQAALQPSSGQPFYKIILTMGRPSLI